MNYIPGNTSLIRLESIEKEYSIKCSLFAKVESTNPTGSIKDRPVFHMLNRYKEKGILKPNGVVVEATSGNTGISLAFYSKVFNYKAVIVMPISASIQRREMIASYGAELCLVNGGMKECEAKAKEIVNSTPNAFIFNQFHNLDNYEAHYLTTGPELSNQLDNIDYIVAGFGTGGTISGIGKYFKTNGYNTKIIGVEPLESPLITKGYASSHLIQGIGANFVPSVLQKQYIDEIVDVEGSKSIDMARFINKTTSLFVGISSGAALLGAINYIKDNKLENKNVVIIFPDKGDRYSW